jgi:hypothetical protein
MNSGAPWPPQVGGLLPRASEAFGVHDKLARYSLDLTNQVGGPKAKGFERILGITIDAIDHLETQILARICDTPVSVARDNLSRGLNCVVDMPIRGIEAKAHRVCNVRTAWTFDHPDSPPRLVSAYPKP